MLWLEMVDPDHGGGSWDFTRSLWSETIKLRGGTWPYWETFLEVRAGDSILHLQKNKKGPAFVGYSTAETDGFKTDERPPGISKGEYQNYFYRVLLKDYRQFPTPIYLHEVFVQQDVALRSYYYRNKAGQHKLIFYNVQAGKLQPQGGARLTPVDDELAGLLLGSDYSVGASTSRSFVSDAKTGERIQELRSRVGQKDFSDKVRSNYKHRCCFPGCPIAEDQFLVASHIARWADVQELRGSLNNGL